MKMERKFNMSLYNYISGIPRDFTINWTFISILSNIILFWIAYIILPHKMAKERKLSKLMDFQYEFKKYLYTLIEQLLPADPDDINSRMVKVWFPNDSTGTNEIINIIMGKCNGITGGLIPTYKEWVDMRPIHKDTIDLAREFGKVTKKMRESCEEPNPKQQEHAECEHIKIMIRSLLLKNDKLKIK
jgi:hypothetical protein